MTGTKPAKSPAPKRASGKTAATAAAGAASVETEQITTLKDFSLFIEDKLPLTDAPWWYRGQSKASYPLIPSLYRHPTITAPQAVIELESKVLTRFKERSIPFAPRTFATDLETLFYMQHFGIPTRLLDWSENPYVGLYFALSGALAGPSEAAVWIVNPAKWNRKVLYDLGFAGNVISTDEEQYLKGHRPGEKYDHMRMSPLCIYGTHNSARIVAQRGVFVLFGKDNKPMETTCISDAYPAKALLKIVIPAANVTSMFDRLLTIGFTDSVVFPDMQGLALELKRFFNFKV